MTNRTLIAAPLTLGAVLASAVLYSPSAWGQDFEAGAIIIPMDQIYQDEGMFLAFGLVYELLLNDVHISWVIKEGKVLGEVDFVASSTDLQSGATISAHDYAGGPWVIDAADADAAMPVIEAWQSAHPTTAVHVASGAFAGDVAHRLVAAPTIAMVADGNEDVARKYMLAAQIPDSVGDLTWPDESPDMLDIDELMGPTDTLHNDGALYDEDGSPTYCQLMSMHWGVGDAEDNPGVVAEVRNYLNYPTHFFAECQAVNAFENTLPHGLFLTTMGFEIGDKPDEYDYYNQDTPYAQHTGVFQGVGGSEPAYTLPEGGAYKGTDVVMITRKDTPIGHDDVWMTGFVDGLCPESAWAYNNLYAAGPSSPGAPAEACLTAGKVSYLGGHEYDTEVPMSENPESIGARLFLNSLFEAPCATSDGEPQITLELSGPATTTVPTVTYTIDYANVEGVTALSAILSEPIPAGAEFVSATEGGALNGNTVEWDLGNIGQWEGGSLEFTLNLTALGGYDNQGTLDYKVSLNDRTIDSNLVHTEYVEQGSEETGDATADGGDDGTADATADGTADGTTDASADGSGDTGSASQSDTGSASASESADAGTEESGDEAGQADEGARDGCACSSAPKTGQGPLGLLGLGVVLMFRRRRVG